ncbi:hypothetical protein VTO73DRAFT_4026 [Trametes versicolor]
MLSSSTIIVVVHRHPQPAYHIVHINIRCLINFLHLWLSPGQLVAYPFLPPPASSPACRRCTSPVVGYYYVWDIVLESLPAMQTLTFVLPSPYKLPSS